MKFFSSVYRLLTFCPSSLYGLAQWLKGLYTYLLITLSITGGENTQKVPLFSHTNKKIHTFRISRGEETMKKVYSLLAVLLVLAVLLTACGGQPAEEPAEEAFKVAQVTDLGGIDDKSFNATAYKGIEQAVAELGVEGKYLESQQQADYAKNIQQLLDEGTDLIVTVGFLLGVDTATAAKANPEQNFAIVDYAYPDCWPGAEEGKDCGSSTELSNVLGLTFATDQAGFLAGYDAACDQRQTADHLDPRQ